MTLVGLGKICQCEVRFSAFSLKKRDLFECLDGKDIFYSEFKLELKRIIVMNRKHVLGMN